MPANDPMDNLGKCSPKESVVPSGEPLKMGRISIEEAVDLIITKITLKMALSFVAICCTILSTAFGTYITIYTGYIPYKEWTCVSEKCKGLLASADDAKNFYSYESMCDNDLVAGSDFEWSSPMQTFSMDWDFYCGNETKLSIVSSVIFIGSLLGLLVSTSMFDKIGRKRGAIVGGVLGMVSLAGSSVAPNYIVLLLLRIVSGFGLMVNYTGSYCWVLELAPTFLRNPISGFFTLGWTAGVFILIGLSKLIGAWKYLYVATGVLAFLGLLPFFILPVPESPRFSLIKGKKDEALKTLKLMATMSNSDVCVENFELVYEERNQSYLEQLKDFKLYPTMLSESVLSTVTWFIVALISYSYQFGWSKIGSDLHSIYFFAGLGDGIAYSTSVPVCKFLGRKKATIFYFCLVIAMNLLAMLDVPFSDDWSLEHFVSMIGNIGASSAFVMMYLYSTELAPTSHRGMILCTCNSFARVGSFIGPYTSLLYGLTDRRVPLAMFAALALIACVMVWFLPDTTGRSVPETPGDVEKLREGLKKGVANSVVIANKNNGHLA